MEKQFQVTNKIFDISELIGLEASKQRAYILEKAIEKFSKIDKGIFMQSKTISEIEGFFNIPASWFIRKDDFGTDF